MALNLLKRFFVKSKEVAPTASRMCSAAKLENIVAKKRVSGSCDGAEKVNLEGGDFPGCYEIEDENVVFHNVAASMIEADSDKCDESDLHSLTAEMGIDGVPETMDPEEELKKVDEILSSL